MKHSPGTWEAEFVGHCGPGDNPTEVWEVNNGHARIAENMTEADARLLAAAPTLAEALRFILADLNSTLDTEARMIAEAALAKASG